MQTTTIEPGSARGNREDRRRHSQADVERIARSLGGAARCGEGWKCRCPAHDDRHPSLSLRLGDGGKLLAHCYAGCDWPEVRDQMRARGLLLDDGPGERPPERKKAQAGNRRLVAVYDYVDENGDLLFQKLRYDPKSFSQRRPDGKGGHVYDRGDVRPVLYRLPEVLAAEEAWVCEGEKDADNLRKLGLVATTSPDGASKAAQQPKWLPEHSAALAGKRLIFLPHNDDQGRAHTKSAARSCLAAGAASVRVITLEDVPEKGGDVSDWLGRGHTIDELRALADRSLEWAPEPEPELADGKAEAAAGQGAEAKAVLEEMNAEYFVAMIGGRVRIGTVRHDPDLKRNRMAYIPADEFKLFFANRKVVTGRDGEGRPTYSPVGHWWLKHARRRTYQGVTLDPSGRTPPDVLNLWRGWGVEPKAGDWPLTREFLLEVICSGDRGHLEYLLGWCAHCVQRPELPAEVAVVLRGLKGTGKSSFAKLLESIFRHHAARVSQPRHLTGNFNSHLDNTLLLIVEEAFWGGDKQAEGPLKSLITDPTLMIERKGVDLREVPNRLKVVMSSNNDWVVPATADERRFFVPDVSAARKGDRDYWTALHAAIEGDETAAFLDFLLKLDLDGFEIRNAPHTQGLNRQKLANANSVQRFWLDCLREGTIVGFDGAEWPRHVATRSLHDAYLCHARNHGEGHPDADAEMARKLAKLWCGCEASKRRLPAGGAREKRPWGYVLDTLAKHRESFARAMGIGAEDMDCPSDEGDDRG